MSDTGRGPHCCHHPHCSARVPARLFACGRHWHLLPLTLRNRIWGTYVKGQEIRRDPSQAYLDAARDAVDWWLDRARKAAESASRAGGES